MITSTDNEKLKLIRKLASRRARDREQLFATEGEDLAREGLAAGWAPVFMLRPQGTNLSAEFQAEEVEAELFRRHSSLGSGSRLIAVWGQQWCEPSGPVCLYLDGLADPGNVGTIVRTAHALVEGSVVIGERTADPYSPKAVRASMGSVFHRAPSQGCVHELPKPRVALSAHLANDVDGEYPQTVNSLPRPPLTICVGAEREGLSPETVRACDATYTIPMRKAGAESLNAAVAAAICCEQVSSPFVGDADD